MEFIIRCSHCQRVVACHQHEMYWHCSFHHPICKAHCLKFQKGVHVGEELCHECRMDAKGLKVVVS
jgi:hypothetical protein